MNTRNKRASVLGFALAALVVLPAPDAVIDAADRAHVTFSYAGIQASQPILAPSDIVTVDVTIRRTVILDVSLHRHVDVQVER